MTPRVGDFFLSRASGRLRGRAIAWAARTPYAHGGIYVGPSWGIVHASSRFEYGAELGDVDELDDPRWSQIEMTGRQRDAIARAAVDMLGTPFPPTWPWWVGIVRQYSGDITRPHADQPAWVRALLHPGKAYCLQVITRAYRAAGIELVDDGRPADLVRPADLLPFVGEAGR